tara:strand:+ start:340 stop:915 length:576 start_codon:yes stop_codon:yes gene_type:complete
MTNLPAEQCEKKIKLYSLFQELAELSDDNLIPSLLNHFQRESMQFQNTENFYVDFPSNEKKQSTYFMYKNTIDALMWLYVKKNNELESETKSVDKGFVFSTSQIIKLLKVSKSDLFALREANQLVEGTDYIREDRNSKAATRYAPILYNVFKTCRTLYGISYHDFCQPEFDLEEHKRRRTREIFKEANRKK